MKYNYQFSSIIGSSYQNGHITFTPDGNSILSPIGNNVSILHLKRDEIKTVEVNSTRNIEFISVSPKDPIMLCINEAGEMSIVSTITGHIINTHEFRHQVNCVSFSPDGKLFAVGRRKLVMVYYTPAADKPMSQLRLQRTYDGANGNITSIDWSTSSKAFAVGSEESSTRIYSAFKTNKLIIYSLGGNRGSVIKSSFMRDSLDVFSVSKNAQLCYWKCNKKLDFLDSDEILEQYEASKNKKDKNVVTYLKAKNYFYQDIATDKHIDIEVTVADFHKGTNFLVTGFVDGKIMIHEMPDFSPRYYLSVGSGEIHTISFNSIGAWIAIGSRDHNELNVFCWKSQSYIFQSKGHMRSTINCLDYSPDGNQLITGGHDGSIKLWQISSGRCCATFNIHSGPVTGVTFPRKRCQLIFSSALDGTVRGFDLNRLKNFCALTAENRAYQLTCVGSDDMGQLVAAGGGSDCFSVLVWDVKTRKLCYFLSGHEQPVCSLQFSSVAGGTHLVSGSWDKSLRVWQLSGEQTSEVITTSSDVLAVAFRPDGVEIAAALLNGSIVIFNSVSGDQVAEIEGKHDLGLSKNEGEMVTAKKASEEKQFQTLCYSANGLFLLAGGNSKYICMYSIEQRILLGRFQISCNESLEGVLEVHDRRRITQWGFSDIHIDMSAKKSIPGITKDTNCKRSIKLDASISCVKFSPTGTNFAASTSEGVMIFSNERLFRCIDYVGGGSDFSQLQLDISPLAINKLLEEKKYSLALNNALKLKKIDILTRIIESIPIGEVSFIMKQLNIHEVGLALARFLVVQFRSSVFITLYSHWLRIMMVCWTLELGKTADPDWHSVITDIENVTRMNKCKLIGFHSSFCKSLFLSERTAENLLIEK